MILHDPRHYRYKEYKVPFTKIRITVDPLKRWFGASSILDFQQDKTELDEFALENRGHNINILFPNIILTTKGNQTLMWDFSGSELIYEDKDMFTVLDQYTERENMEHYISDGRKELIAVQYKTGKPLMFLCAMSFGPPQKSRENALSRLELESSEI